MNYDIADFPFGHANAVSLDNRPFASVEEMEETLIQDWNADSIWQRFVSI